MEKVQAIVLSWNNLDTLKGTVRRLRKEVPVTVVDNGSTDGTRLYLADLGKDINYIQMGENVGSSIARNMAIKQVKTPYFFLIDGDILYVPDSIKYLFEIIEKHPECGCVGVNDPSIVAETGMNGVPDEFDADIRAKPPRQVFKGFPMAWTQYAMFRNTGQRFVEAPPFDQYGHGYEDSWWYWEMKQNYGLESYFVTRPMYYHDAHAGKRELAKAGLPTNEEARRKAFHERFGEIDWLDRSLNIVEVEPSKLTK